MGRPIRFGPVVAFFLVFVVAGLAAAEEQKPFTAAELNKLLTDMPKFARYAREKGELFEEIKDPNLFQAMRFSTELNEYLEKLGWTPERFGWVLSRVMAGLTGAHLSAMAPQLKKQLEAQREQIKKTPLPAAQKKQALAELDKALSEIEAQQTDLGQEVGLTDGEMRLIETNRQKIIDILQKID